MKTVSIFGTEYSFEESDLNNPELAQADGVCKIFDKEIIVRKPEYMGGSSSEAQEARYDHVLRHELIHAFAQECGVPHGNNEDLVDWLAHIIPAVNDAFAKLKGQVE